MWSIFHKKSMKICYFSTEKYENIKDFLQQNWKKNQELSTRKIWQSIIFLKEIWKKIKHFSTGKEFIY